jgi:putative tryptophan/tyrosine transport system substrate-binding protein
MTIGNRQPATGNSKRLKLVLYALCAMLFALCSSAQTQHPAKVPRIGWLTAAPHLPMMTRAEAFREGLRELGYIEGKNIVIEWRSPAEKPDRMRMLAAELVRLKLDVIVTAGEGVTRHVKEATSTIPIVMAQDSDPVGNGFVASLARPGGNITGLASLAPELSGKQLELLKETVPRLSRVAVFATSTSADYARVLKETELAATAFGGKIRHVDVRSPKDIETAFRAAVQARADAVLMLVAGDVASAYRNKIAELAVTSRLPVMYERRGYVEAGGLMFYGVNLQDLDRRAATYVDKILKGAKPADLPVEQPTKFELVINLKAAKQIGLTIPPNILARADKIIR